MNKASLIDRLAEKAQVNKKQATDLLEGLVEIIITELKAGQEVTITGFGTFMAKSRHARGGVNPQKPNERIQIPEVKVAKFKTGKTLKDALKGKHDQAPNLAE
ncbi:MAG: HU family DNA-binding protein [bacterium]